MPNTITDRQGDFIGNVQDIRTKFRIAQPESAEVPVGKAKTGLLERFKAAKLSTMVPKLSRSVSDPQPRQPNPPARKRFQSFSAALTRVDSSEEEFELASSDEDDESEVGDDDGLQILEEAIRMNANPKK